MPESVSYTTIILDILHNDSGPMSGLKYEESQCLEDKMVREA